MNIPFLSRRRPGDSCLQCGAPFESSAELVSVRRGTRFLVDINATRAWRRCSSCGVAELLGNDTARALVREVLVRAHPEIISSRGEVSLGAVEVDLVDRDTAPAPTSASGAVSLLTRARARVRLIRRVDAAFFVIAIGIGSLHGVRGAASMLVLLALIVAIESLGKAIETFKTSRASSTVRGLLSVCVVLAVIAVAPGFTDLAWLTPWVTIGMVIGLTVIARITDPWIRRLIRPSRGNAVSRAWLDEATITLPVGPGAILLRGVDGREYLGPAAVNVLLHSTAADIA